MEKYNRKIQKGINTSIKATEGRIMKSLQLQNAANRSIVHDFHIDTKNEFEETRRKNQEALVDLKEHITAELTRLTTPMKMKPDNHSRLTSGSCVPSNLVVDDGSYSRDSLSTVRSSKASLASVPLTVHNRMTDLHKEEVKKTADLEQRLRSMEVKNKQLQETLRVKTANPLTKKLSAKPRKQPLSENMENSINIHVGNNINGRASRSSARTPLGDANQDTSNPGLRRSARRCATRN